MKNLNSIFITIFFFSFNATAWQTCHPIPHFWENQFIIGYGSLLNESSKKKTSDNTAANTPVFLKDYQRIWSVQIHHQTYLGVKPHQGHRTSAVFFKLPFYEVKDFDRREQAYCRIKMPPSNIISIPSTRTLPKGEFWLYIPKIKAARPIPAIPQYYRKLYLDGCKKIAHDIKLKSYYQSCLEDLPKTQN